MTDLIKLEIIENEIFATSLNIAKVFGRQHKDVFRAIENLTCSANFRERNFTLSTSVSLNRNKREYKTYNLTQNGFVFLVMGFTGKDASKFKEAYIAKFDEMREMILDKIAKEKVEQLDWVKARKVVALDFKAMNDALKLTREKIGKDTKTHSYTNEANMLNRIILGLPAKEYKELNNIKNVRDNLDSEQLKRFVELQKLNESLIAVELNYQERMKKITKYYNDKYSIKLENKDSK